MQVILIYMIRDFKHLQDKLENQPSAPKMKTEGKKKDVRSWRVMIGIFIAITILALFFLVLGILKHKETGLLKATWDGNRVVRYSLTEGEDVLWTADTLPLGVFVERGSRDRRDALRVAIMNTNYQVGCDVLEVTTNRSSARVLVDLEAAMPVGVGHGEGGGVSHFLDNGEQRATLDLYGVATTDLMALTLEHEFGHVLGLGHDDFRTSVMFPEITNESITVMRMTDNDRKLLRGLYCDW